MYGGNTAMPSEHRQPVHGDATHLWPRLEVAHPPAMLVVNVPVVDMHPENGGTEIWPGTHRIVAAVAGQDIKIPPDMLEARRAVSPPLQPVVPLGSVLIRDMRLWHAGMPNRTDRPRPMIAMIHNAGWLETGDPLRFPAGTEEFFDHPILQTCARFVDEPIDHIRAPHGYEYEK
jgi:ectoine hydroxylase-related dioxygenase (phytanoyl-CoA dioxygenase family)